MGQIHFAIWTNTFCNLDKYILQLQAALSQYHAVQTMPIWSLANTTHQMDITDAVRIWTPCHNDHIAYVATTHLISGTGIENLRYMPFWPPSSYGANMLPASGTRSDIIMPRHTHPLTSFDPPWVGSHHKEAWLTHIVDYSGLRHTMAFRGLQCSNNTWYRGIPTDYRLQWVTS